MIRHVKMNIHIVYEFIIDASKGRMVFLSLHLQVNLLSFQVRNVVAPLPRKNAHEPYDNTLVMA